MEEYKKACVRSTSLAFYYCQAKIKGEILATIYTPFKFNVGYIARLYTRLSLFYAQNMNTTSRNKRAIAVSEIIDPAEDLTTVVDGAEAFEVTVEAVEA